MKNKLLFAFVLVLAIISIQITVLADMDAPHINPYEATISNINGATYYSFDWATQEFLKVGELNYGDKIEIIYEENIKNETYGDFYINEEQTGEMFLIKTSDMEVFEESNVVPQKLDYENKKDSIVLKEDGLEIYIGPAYGYTKLDTVIPKNTKITLYNDEAIGMPWYYVEYEGNSGWVCILNGTIGFEPEYENYEMMTYKDLKVYKDTTYEDVIGTIPANTKIEKFWDIDDWSWGKYIAHGNISGYIESEEIATNSPWMEGEELSYTVDYPAKMYKEGDLRSEVLIEEIPEGTELSYTISSNARYLNQWIYTTYNGISGWVYNMEFAFLDEGETYQDHLDEVLASYEEEGKEVIEDEIDKNEEFKQIEDGNVENKSTEEKNGGTDITSEKTVSGMQILLICIMLAIVISLTSFVTILLVNKKNKQNKE